MTPPMINWEETQSNPSIVFPPYNVIDINHLRAQIIVKIVK